jgi:hypothetical protein
LEWSVVVEPSSIIVMVLARDKPNLRTEVGHISNDYTKIPWGYWNDPEQAYSEAAQYANR